MHPTGWSAERTVFGIGDTLRCERCGNEKRLSKDSLHLILQVTAPHRKIAVLLAADARKFRCTNCGEKRAKFYGKTALYGGSPEPPSSTPPRGDVPPQTDWAFKAMKKDPHSREMAFIADHTGYGSGGENYEHDNTGSEMNYSGVVDDVYNALGEHEGWENGYDY